MLPVDVEKEHVKDAIENWCEIFKIRVKKEFGLEAMRKSELSGDRCVRRDGSTASLLPVAPVFESAASMAVTLTSTLVNRLASTSEKTNFLVMRDDINCRARHLFCCFLRKSVNNPACRTSLILMQTVTSDFDQFSGLTVYPLFEQWATQPKMSFKDKLLEFGNNCDVTKANRVFIDSLNPLIMLYGLSEIHTMLTFLSQKCESIVTTVFEPAVDSKQDALIRRITTADLKLEPGTSPRHVNVVITHKRKHRTLGHKVEKKEEVVHFLNDYHDFEVVKAERQKKSLIPETSAESDFSRLTFNVSLNAEERAAKEKVALPYVKTETGSKVFYTPDEFDDVDEEDPDDDLGI